MATDTDRKPVLLTVDDDPGVSRAVARDLRRQYGETYRVVRTESGPQALETLRELKLRGDPVAVLLADHRMPDMSGLEFLEEAMDLFPHARRALLTAYADTDQRRRPGPLPPEAVGSARGEAVSGRRLTHRHVAQQ
jgi:thioredoxin reductase (NADPH)